MTPSLPARLIEVAAPAAGAALRLVCLPHAGGGSSAYRPWTRRLSRRIELALVHLPGREGRFLEPAFRRLDPLVERLASAIEGLAERPFALFGHSMGALVGFELARELRRRGAPAPAHLFVSGHRAPHLPYAQPRIHHLPDRDFLERVVAMNGTPAEVLENQELMDLLLPTLRADFELVETYSYRAEKPLDCGITAFGGLSDHRLGPARLRAWRTQTRGPFALRMYAGGHFFLHDDREAFLAGLDEALAGLPAGPEDGR